ncbi:TPA: ATP-dependent endonuclease [Vibrio vulnificus]|uniref:ATP-dependent nuclease n=1 Tax=Vibrio vulnificus TaxID=672 RepID=UPI0019D46499|nr:ATP-dependent endonuclease [Vibrio vulnificus]MBN8147542.1 ATP-dependent endonuclease [Vibrio vulnificus]HAS6163776.1 AAA family ATPase [Vibrio vulnificus]HDY7864536.1 ATP-dependent endonuclease [Vibrio vulnificus]HDY7878391.1 ATP-dependent endonuclease [Vibrio vulnificus]
MKVARIEISNFRLLKSFALDLEDELSLVIGKNNTGKTSVLACLDKLAVQSDKKAITYEDFNVDLMSSIEAVLLGEQAIGNEEEYSPLGIQLKLYIKYSESDDLSKISSLIMSLDPTDDNVLLSFEYKIAFDKIVELKSVYTKEAEKYENSPRLFLKENLSDYFGTIVKKSLLIGDEKQFIDLNKERINLKDILSIQFINAKRSVTNKQNDKTLSNQTSSLYKQVDESDEQVEASNEFKKELRKADTKLSGIYQNMFEGVIEKVNRFGGISPTDTTIKVVSTLQHRELLEGNTTVMYQHQDHDLPEHYNGLGYMNLISMIFEIEMLMSRFRKSLKEQPASINLLFIEEPEAHTHPQMQYVFIKNIKKLLKENRLREDGKEIHLQSIITTHSSHIVSESCFDDIKYLKKTPQSHQVQAKNLKDLELEYASKENPERDAELKQSYRFLKQYLTLNRAELFFADKAIFIEGDTERVILPAMMKKIDQSYEGGDVLPLLSQNISMVEVGAHSQTFEKFIDFIGLKSLIITDIDSNKEVPKDDDPTKTKRVKCRPNEAGASQTSNASLEFFFGKKELAFYKAMKLNEKSVSKCPEKKVWKQDPKGLVKVIYQVEENDYLARSFEDAFFHINKELLNIGHNAFPSLTKKYYDSYQSGGIDAYEFAEKAVNSKPSLAIEVLLNSKVSSSENTESEIEFSNWNVPLYIKEGLLWLQQS